LDSHIRSRIQDELARLRQEEESIKQEIELALEKENLDRERELAGEESVSEDDAQAAGGVKSSAAMIGDLEDLKHKVDRYQKRREDISVSELQAKSSAVVDCYRSHASTSLDCWKEVNNFRLSVVELEQHYVDTLR